MEHNAQNWKKLYERFDQEIRDFFEMYVLSDYEDLGGTFLLVSPTFNDILPDDRQRWLNEVLVDLFDKDFLEGNVLTPAELICLTDEYVFDTQMEAYVVEYDIA